MILDYLLTILHLLIIGVNLTAWIWPATRKLHLVVAGITAACWLIFGIWYGIGYCPLTDWHWQLKEKLGEQHLPASFIKYIVDGISGGDSSPVLIDWLTGLGFLTAIILSVYFNFFRKPKTN